MSLSPKEVLDVWDAQGLLPPGDAAQALVQRAMGAGLTLNTGQTYIVASLIQLAMEACELKAQRAEDRLVAAIRSQRQ